MKRPIVIEFSGLPNSGKTTLLHNLEKLCNSNGVNAVYIQETAELLPECIPKGSIEQNLWINFETLQRSLELNFISDLDFIFLDRGFYNQLFWASLYSKKDPQYCCRTKRCGPSGDHRRRRKAPGGSGYRRMGQ